MALVKAQILNGTRYTEEFYVEELKGSVKIRPLSDGEVTEIENLYYQELSKAGIKVEELEKITESKADMVKSATFMQITKMRDWRIIAKGLSVDEEWTAEDVRGLGKPINDKLLARITELTNGSYEEIKSFRGELGREAPEITD